MATFTLNDLLQNASYINGQWYRAKSSTFDVHNKLSNERIIAVSNGGVEAAEQAIIVAHQALTAWQQKTAAERAKYLMAWFDLIIAHQQPLAELMTLELGKPLTESLGEVNYGASFIEWFAEEGKRCYGDIIPSAQADKHIFVIKQGVGVAAAITPWNFPNAMIARKAAAALAAGCTFVVRPDERTPLSALALAKLADEAEIPAGVFNVVVGTDAAAIGQVLTTHPLVAKFSFTGSTRVGRLLNQQCASSLKKVSMELGGNAPFIVFDDADINQAIIGAMASKFRNAGQTCVCANRFYVQRKVYQDFHHQFIEQVNQLRLADIGQQDYDIGPMISVDAAQKAEQLIAQAIAEGATLAAGGKTLSHLPQLLPPTVLVDVAHEQTICQQELFAPIAVIIPFDDEQQVIAMANDTDAGLAAYCYTNNLSRAMRLAKQLDYGMVGINEGIISTAVAPFGGVKASGFGREGSKYGLDDYLTLKYICVGS